MLYFFDYTIERDDIPNEMPNLMRNPKNDIIDLVCYRTVKSINRLCSNHFLCYIQDGELEYDVWIGGDNPNSHWIQL